jgi:hypothetical protein
MKKRKPEGLESDLLSTSLLSQTSVLESQDDTCNLNFVARTNDISIDGLWWAGNCMAEKGTAA